MAERIIHATPQEVEALLAGRLTTFWRPVKGPWDYWCKAHGGTYVGCTRDGQSTGWKMEPSGEIWHHPSFKHLRCPYGQPGDLLAVKEVWRPWYRVGGRCTNGTEGILYRADESSVEMRLPLGCWQLRRATDWRSPATMPRWAVRDGFIRPITSVQVKQVQTMDGYAAQDAGMFANCDSDCCDGWTLLKFRKQWDARYTNTAYAWSENPPAWVITIGGNDV